MTSSQLSISFLIQKRKEKNFFIKYKQGVSPSRASSAKQRTEWGGKELHTGTETTRHRCPGTRYGKTGKGGGGDRRSEGIGLTHAHGEGGGGQKRLFHFLLRQWTPRIRSCCHLSFFLQKHRHRSPLSIFSSWRPP